MGRARGDSGQVKSNRKLRNGRYRANQATMEHNRERDKLYRQKKREQARLQRHPDRLAQLADMATQQRYLRDASEMPADRVQEEEEREPIVDAGIVVEEDGEILEGFTGRPD